MRINYQERHRQRSCKCWIGLLPCLVGWYTVLLLFTTHIYHKIEQSDHKQTLRARNLETGSDMIVATVSSKESTNLLRLQRDLYYRFRPMEPKTESTKKAHAKECGLPPYETYFAQAATRRSSHYEDTSLYKLFFKDTPDTSNMTFVEVGGYDGMQGSNSRFFETCLDWKGLLVEVNRKIFPMLELNRPHADVVSLSPTCRFDPLTGYRVKQGRLTNETELNATTTLLECDNPTSRLERTPGSLVLAMDQWTRSVQVPCGSLTSVILDHFANGAVTLLTVDVMGAEAWVAETLDFDKLKIDIVVLANTHPYCQAECTGRDRARRVMTEAGYILYKAALHESDLYIHPQSRFVNSLPSPKAMQDEQGWETIVHQMSKSA
jgi:hypothetical protein